MEHRFINEIGPGEELGGVYLVKEPILRSTAKGDPYIAMYLCDKTGQLNARMWQAGETIYRAIPKPGFVRIQGRSELYQNNLQLVINNIAVVDGSKVKIDDYLARTDKDVAQLFEDIKKILGKIKNEQLRSIVGAFLSDDALMERFRNSPGGTAMHHDYLGGLIEHTHNMLRVATAILPLYPQVQADLVLAGVFIHDMGKTEELSYDLAFAYTDSGQLIGHITKTHLMLHRKADALVAKGVRIDGAVLDALGHIVLSHHGEYQFGSPKLPATPEAFMVYYIDDLDAKMNQVTSVIDSEGGESNWTSWQKPLETRLYRRRIE